MTKHFEESAKKINIEPFLKKRAKPRNSEPLESKTDFLLDVVQKLSLAKDLETIMNIVRKAARKLTGSDGSTFVLRDDNQCYYADEDAIAPLWKGKRFPMSICISGWVMLNRQPVVIEDIYADPRIPAEAYRPTFVKSLAMVPIRTESPIGAIGTYWAEKYCPNEGQVNLLKALADSTSIAMENIQLHSELQQGFKENSEQAEIALQLREANQKLESTLGEINRRNEEMQWLKELGSSLQTCIRIDEAYKLVASYSRKLLPNASGTFYSMHPSRNYLEAMISWKDPALDEKIIKPEECLALRRGSTYSVDDPQNELVCSHFREIKDLKPYSCIPLFAQSDIIGLYYLEWDMQSTDNSEALKKKSDQAMLASMIGEQIAIGISNIKLRETLKNQSFRDQLTGLYNRRYLEETFDRELNRCGRKSASMAILMLDIDHFKQFNDKFGHEAGDMVLQAFANVLRNTARKEDIACRFGGEEFILIFPEIELEAAILRTKAIHEAVSQVHLRYGGVALTQITVSIGLALFPLHGENMHELISASDMALYEAKNTGRNKTVVFTKK